MCTRSSLDSMIRWGTFCHTQPVQRSLSSASGISITAGMIHCSHKRCCENGRNWKQSFKCCHVYHFPNLTCQPRLMYSPDSYTYSATHLRGPMAPPGIFEQRTHRVESTCHSSWQDQEWRHGGKHQCQDWSSVVPLPERSCIACWKRSSHCT